MLAPMTLSFLITNLIAALLLPPLNLLLLATLGLVLLKRRPRAGRLLLGGSLLGLWLFSTPMLADALIDSLKPPFQKLTAAQADAIVILGGGRSRDTLDYGGDTVGALTLERIRYGAHLARALKKPVLVTGGAPEARGLSEGEVMRRALETEFSTPVRWVEGQSRNTLENATYSAPLLKADGIRRIYLVSHAWHLRRAVPAFEAQGLAVTPAGFGYFNTGEGPGVFDLLPNAKALLNSYYAVHEWVGVFWYQFKS